MAERPRPPSLTSRQVLDFSLQQKLRPLMEHLTPLPSIYYPDFIAANQADRATNVLPGQARPPCDARACGACTGTRACRTTCCPLRRATPARCVHRHPSRCALRLGPQDKKKHLDQVRKDIRDFKAQHKLDKVRRGRARAHCTQAHRRAALKV